LVFSGFKTGTVVAYLLSPIIIDSLGSWRALFYTYGSFGFLVMVIWLILAKDTPTYHPSPVLPRTITFATTTAASESRLDYNMDDNLCVTRTSSYDATLKLLQDAPWQEFLRSKGAWAMLLAHSAKNWGLYNTLSWTPTFYAEEYGIGVRDSAILSVLPSMAGIVGGFIAGFSVDTILRQIQTTNAGISDEQKTLVRKCFQGFSLYGAAIALGCLAFRIPEEPWVTQSFLTASVGIQAFGAAGFEGGNQDKAGEKWAGLLYSVTSLPAVMCEFLRFLIIGNVTRALLTECFVFYSVGTLGVWVTGRVLDLTHQDWSYVFALTAGINVLGATAFVLLFDSKREFE
jgi:Major Facilitator Superfamily